MSATTAPSTTWGQWFSWFASSLYHMGIPINLLVKPKWSLDQMGSQAGKVVLITGGNSGTGYATAKAYYDRGARVIIACRSEERAAKAMEDIKRGGEVDIAGNMVYTPTEATGSIEYVHLDLSDLDSVAACAEKVLNEEKLDLLFANAGIMALPPGSYTKQGYSLQFGTNVLGHQRLISLLLPLLQKTALLTGTPARLIVLASAAHNAAPRGGIKYDSMRRGEKLLGEWTEYGESKWGDIALARHVDLHYGPNSGNPNGTVLATAIHPGMVRTNLWTHLGPAQFMLDRLQWVVPLMNVTGATGALNQIWAGQLGEKDAVGIAGKYVVPYQVVAEPRPDLNDPAKWEELWRWCDEQVAKAE